MANVWMLLVTILAASNRHEIVADASSYKFSDMFWFFNSV